MIVVKELLTDLIKADDIPARIAFQFQRREVHPLARNQAANFIEQYSALSRQLGGAANSSIQQFMRNTYLSLP